MVNHPNRGKKARATRQADTSGTNYRYILIDPYAKTVTEHNDPRLTTEPHPYLDALYEIMECGHVEWHAIASTKPKHVLILDETGLFHDPIPPTFSFNGISVVGKAMITGSGRGHRSSSPATISLDQVRSVVKFDVLPKQRHQPIIKTFDTTEELFAELAARRGKGF
jgi:hypothetical protein